MWRSFIRKLLALMCIIDLVYIPVEGHLHYELVSAYEFHSLPGASLVKLRFYHNV